MRLLRRVRSGIVLTILVALIAGGGYVGWVLIQRSHPVELPAPTGSFAVGRVTYEWTDKARKDPFAPVVGTPRRLAVWIWYPAVEDRDGVPAPYAPGLWSGVHLSRPVSLLRSPPDMVRGSALEWVAVAPGRFPIVVLEPGMGLSALLYSSVAEDVASHGYVVAAVTPTYSADLTVLGGQKVTGNEQGNPDDLLDDTPEAKAKADRIVAVWAADARFVAKTVAAQNSTGLFKDRINTTAPVSYVGHSFGGAAALEACRLDQRCGGAVDLDGSQFGQVVKRGVKAPILLLGSEDSCITGTCGPDAKDDPDDRARAQELLRASTGAKWCGTIDGARHFNFTDYGAFYLALPLRKRIPLGSIDPGQAMAIQNGYVIRFLDHVIRHVPAPDAPICQPRASS